MFPNMHAGTLMELKWKLGLKMAANVEITALATLAIVNEGKKKTEAYYGS